MTNLATLLRTATAHAMRGVNTAMPGRILSYDAGAQSASVQPLVKMKVPGSEDEESLPVLNAVPVIWPRAGGASMTFPVRSGDGCLVIFCQRSIDEFKESGDAKVPQDPRAFDLTDAVAIMGLVSFGNGGGPDDAVCITYGSSTILVKQNEVKIDTPALTVNAPDVTIKGNVAITGNLGITGDSNMVGGADFTGGPITHNGVNIGSTHKHGGVESGGSNTDGPH